MTDRSANHDEPEPRAGAAPRKSLMRSLGEFVGHIVSGVRTDPARSRHEVRRTVEEEDRGDMVLRRTTIEEVEIRRREPDE